MIEYIIPVITALGGGIIAWFFGGKQSNETRIDNESHKREKEYFEMVEVRTDKEVKKFLRRIVKCAKTCSHSANCPVLVQWGDELDN